MHQQGILTELLETNKVPAPKSVIIRSFDPEWKTGLMEQLDFPMVLKFLMVPFLAVW